MGRRDRQARQARRDRDANLAGLYEELLKLSLSPRLTGTLIHRQLASNMNQLRLVGIVTCMSCKDHEEDASSPFYIPFYVDYKNNFFCHFCYDFEQFRTAPSSPTLPPLVENK